MYGFIGKVLRVDLSSGALSEEAISEEDARLFLGGSGLATKYLIDELAPGVDPLGPENKLIYMTGPLTGTASPSAGRFAAVAKSPLTGLWGEANSGGRWGCDLKRSGYDGIIIEGKAAAPVVLVIDNGKARLQDAASLWGKNVFETTATLKQDLGKKFNISCIGIAGEKLVRYAAIMNDEHRALGRCGLGCGHGVEEPEGHRRRRLTKGRTGRQGCLQGGRQHRVRPHQRKPAEDDAGGLWHRYGHRHGQRERAVYRPETGKQAFAPIPTISTAPPSTRVSSRAEKPALHALSLVAGRLT